MASREWQSGFVAGWNAARSSVEDLIDITDSEFSSPMRMPMQAKAPARKRKLSAWNKFVKANSKKPRFIYKSGAKKGKLNLKAMAVAFRKTPAGKKSKK